VTKPQATQTMSHDRYQSSEIPPRSLRRQGETPTHRFPHPPCDPALHRRAHKHLGIGSQQRLCSKKNRQAAHAPIELIQQGYLLRISRRLRGGRTAATGGLQLQRISRVQFQVNLPACRLAFPPEILQRPHRLPRLRISRMAT
jgi:hypothetical protein